MLEFTSRISMYTQLSHAEIECKKLPILTGTCLLKLQNSRMTIQAHRERGLHLFSDGHSQVFSILDQRLRVCGFDHRQGTYVL